jgi:uncharacterized protein (DUF58 family)
MTISSGTLRQIRRIELRTRKLVRGTFAGAYHSSFKGQGIVFDSVRPYQPGDDVRIIDWNVTARAGEAYVKRFVEDRELTVMLALDTSASCLYGTRRRQKRDLAAELGAVIALSATANNDRVGLLTFSDKIETYIFPKKGRNHILRLIRDLLATPPADKQTDIALGLATINRVLKRSAIVFLMSDFLANPAEYAQDLAATARRHDLITIGLSDPSELQLPDVGIVTLQDAETGDIRWVDTSSGLWRAGFQNQTLRFRNMREDTMAGAGVEWLSLSVEDDYVKTLTQFFRRRRARVRR